MKRALLYMLVLLATATQVFPLAWMVHKAFFAQGPRESFQGMSEMFRQWPIGRWALNSLFVATTQTLLVLLLASLAGFVLAQHRFAGRKLLLGILLTTFFLPPQVLLAGQFRVIGQLHLLNHPAAIFLPGSISLVAVFLLYAAMARLPADLLNAARLDGCGEGRLWWHIALPVNRPMLGAAAMMTFLGAWNSYLWPQVVLIEPRQQTLPIALANLASFPSVQARPGMLLAAVLAAAIPSVLLFLALQKDFLAGLLATAQQD